MIKTIWSSRHCNYLRLHGIFCYFHYLEYFINQTRKDSRIKNKPHAVSSENI